MNMRTVRVGKCGDMEMLSDRAGGSIGSSVDW